VPLRWTYRLLAGGAFCVLLAGLLSACASLRSTPIESRAERGINFSHSQHMNANMACADCHDYTARNPIQVNHDLCGVCHINTHKPSPAQDCAMCHTAPDNDVAARGSRFIKDIIFDHGPHIKNQIDCAQCHGEPDTKPLPRHNLMPSCMECHATAGPGMNECSVCHEELDTDFIPKFRGTQRIQHDSPTIWTKTHGREYLVDAQFCGFCHSDEGYCADCHRRTKPDNHTIHFERQAHGMEAIWNRQNCSVCHEEDSCVRCHETTKPQSHRAGFGSPLNSHCTGCHYPRGSESCAVCHQRMDHQTAMPSIHKFGLYPSNCAACHPGGVPTRAPHLMNSTVECRVCHQ